MKSDNQKNNKWLNSEQINEIKSLKPDFFLDKNSAESSLFSDNGLACFNFDPPRNIEILIISKNNEIESFIPVAYNFDGFPGISLTCKRISHDEFKAIYISYKSACVYVDDNELNKNTIRLIRSINPLTRCICLLNNDFDINMQAIDQMDLDGCIQSNNSHFQLDVLFQIKIYLKLLASHYYKNHFENVVIKQSQNYKDLNKKITKAVVLVSNKNTLLNQQKFEIEKQKTELEKAMKKSSIHYIKLQKSLVINQQQQEQLQNAIADMATLNAQLRQQNEEVLAQREEIENQQHEIKAQRDNALQQFKKIMEQQTEINESLEYASRIQRAILPPMEFAKLLLPDSFILNLPKSIVSGDFYFITQNRSKTVVAAGDATGHGISGALMTMLGIAYLNEIVNKDIITSASEILDKLRSQVIRSLHQTGAIFEANDGFDMSICMIDIETLEMQFAGANNPVYVLRGDDLIELSPDKMPVGIYDFRDNSFHSTELLLQINDMVYMFSDGFADQFGGPDESKFKYKRFRELLKKINSQPSKMQETILKNEFLKWKGNNEQIDDILVIGFRIQ